MWNFSEHISCIIQDKEYNIYYWDWHSIQEGIWHNIRCYVDSI